jgi:hypothetical protein
MTYDEFAQIALELPETTEATEKNGPNVSRNSRSMFWLKKWELLCVKVDWESHDRLLDEHPQVIFKTPHFDSYPAVHAHLDMLSDELARELIGICWSDAPNKVKFRRQPKVD